MKLYQNFFNEFENYITPSDIIEFLYCPRFTYFMKCLGISQYEEKRYKVQKGREIHERKEHQNKSYLRKKIGSISKQVHVQLVSKKLKVQGVVDEVHLLEDKSMAPLDYKFAEYDEKIYLTYKTQLILYALMIEEMFGTIVDKGYLVYCRSRNELVEVPINKEMKDNMVNIINEYKNVMSGYFPKPTQYKSKCLDCCYKNICIK